MRLSRSLLIFLALLVLALATGIGSLVAYNLTRAAAIELRETGDPALLLRCLLLNQLPCEEAGTEPRQERAPLVILTPLITPSVEATATSLPVVTDARSVKPTAVAATPFPTSAPQAALPRISDPRQIRILLLGIDQRSAAGETGPFRTDTMILLNIDPARQTVGVLSLPRDLWVEIPGYEPGRINTANFIGDRDAYPGGGGPALAMETVAANFGFNVDKYLLVNFDVFTAIVDALAPNGVLISVREFIDDPHYPDDRYGTIHVRFEPGDQRLNAERLLQYARTRATEGGDFDRARRQQQTLDAVRAEVLSAGGIINFIAKAPTLWQALSDNYRTNLTLNDILALGGLMGEIKRDDIRYEVVDNLYAVTGPSPLGEMVLYPDHRAVQGLIQCVFYPQDLPTRAEIEARAAAENAPIYVFNGTTQIGLAGETRSWLAELGVAVAGIDNLTTDALPQTEIRNYGGGEWTARQLAGAVGLESDCVKRAGDGLIARGVMLALGADAREALGI